MGKKAEKAEGELTKKEAKKAKKEAEETVMVTAKKTVLGDTATIKRLMDDAAITALLDEDELDYDEDVSLSNVKLVVGFAGVGASLVSHAFPAPFPKNWWVLLYCCAWYFFCSGILQFMLSFMELETILLVQGKKVGGGDGDGGGGGGGKRGEGLNVASHFPRFQEVYTLAITPLPKGAMGLWSAPKFHAPNEPPKPTGEPSYVGGAFQQSWACNHYFDEEGYFDEDSFVDVRRRERQSPRRQRRAPPAFADRRSTARAQAVREFVQKYEKLGSKKEA